jgi:hypothetical protein
VTNTLAYCHFPDQICQLYSDGPPHGRLRRHGWQGPNVIKLFKDIIYEFSQKARVLLHGSPFQLCPMFVDWP